MDKLGLIAGAGNLPVEVARECLHSGRPLFVVRLKGLTDPQLESYPGCEVGIGELGKAIKALKKAGCVSVCMTGVVQRPDFSNLAMDLRGISILPRLALEARKGDDAILRTLVHEFEKEGFRVEGAQEVAGHLALAAGALGRISPSEGHHEDIAKAPKPIQERRMDLPTIGLATVHRAAKAGLAGIVGEAGGLIVLDRDTVIAEADALGLFIYGVSPDEA